MIVPNNRILVRVNIEQKEAMLIGGVWFKAAPLFEMNYREKSPVIAEILEGGDLFPRGTYVICHHNHFYLPSPYHVEHDIFSIPVGKTIFATIDNKGNLTPVFGNILGERIEKKCEYYIPTEKDNNYIDRIKVTDNGCTEYKIGQIILCKPYAPYDIVYNFNGVEKRVTKVSEDMVVGFL